MMDSEFYQKKILTESFIPFLRQEFPASHRLMQDNDPKHCSRSTVAFMTASGVNWWPTPPESPDINVIENVWHALKHHLGKNVKPRTQDELIQGIQDFWGGLTPERCNKYIDHVYKVIPAVIARYGAATGY
jgi:transposase